MRTFLKVADTGSFTAGAEKLGMTPQLASKYVRALEDELSAQLFHRSTRRVTLSDTGTALYERCARFVADYEELKADVRQDTCAPRGDLRITAPHCFGEKYLVSTLAEFSEQFPEINATLDLTDRYVDLLEEGIDLAIRIGSLEDSSFFTRQIGTASVVLCASPKYLATAPNLSHPNELEMHACVVDTNFRMRNKWTFTVNGKPEVFEVSSRLKVNNASAARTLALKGCGVVLIPSYMVTDDLADGQLVQLLEGFTTADLAIHALYPSRRHLTARVRRFIEFTASQIKHLR